MSETNKSLLYLLPLIKDWSAAADFPIDCYAIGFYAPGVICKYPKNSTAIHPNGIIMRENDEFKYVAYFINSMFEADHALLMRGRYSKITDVCKQIILSRSQSEIDYDFLEGVLYKSKKRKRAIERSLDIDDLDRFTSEYESIFGNSEVFNE